MFFRTISVLLCIILAPPVNSQDVIDLNGGDWDVVNANGSIRTKGQVPGNIYLDLLDAEIIGDPYYRFNDVQSRWVAYDNWTYSTSFQVSEDVLQHDRAILQFDGIDSIADILLNDKLVGSSKNMFIKLTIDVKSGLVVGTNSIEVRFTSPVVYAADLSNEYKEQFGYEVPPTCPPAVQSGECHVNMIRKSQSSFSWDWGPAFPGVGIWKDVKILAFSSPILSETTVATKDSEGTGSWELEINLHFLMPVMETRKGAVTVSLDGGFGDTFSVSLESDQDLESACSLTLHIPQESMKIEPWYPSGMEDLGSPRLYSLEISYRDESTGTSSPSFIGEIGFRTVELVQNFVSANHSDGRTFFIRINGHDLFLKGSNWIPADSFPTRMPVQDMVDLLESAKKAGMNALRVWGGGLYESDDFYKAADSLGILIWQDIMFACAMYPNTTDFIGTVSTEVQQQIRRLHHHPSIMLWSGNNENEAALAQNWYATKPQFQMYKEMYVQLYVNTVREIVRGEDPYRPFVVSSPSNGIESEEEGYVAANPADTHYGDVHFYDYFRDTWIWTIYPRARMVSEYGIQSWPSFLLLSKYSIAEDWNYQSAFINSRQHHLFGNNEILVSIVRHFKLPKLLRDSVDELVLDGRVFTFTKQEEEQKVFDDTLWLSQLDQAMGIKTESEFYRRSRSELIDGEGLTMGCLYWQLNDIWPGASWSSIEFGGRWKVLHYMAKDFFHTDLVSPYLDSDNVLKISVVSDRFVQQHLMVTVEVYLWNSTSSLTSKTVELDHPGQSSLIVFSSPLDNIIGKRCPTVQHCFLWFTLTDETGVVLNTNFLLPTNTFVDVQGLDLAEIKVTNGTGPFHSSEGNWTFELNLSTNTVAVFVWLETEHSGYFSKNGFIMKDDSQTVNFYSKNEVSLDELIQSLQIRSLMDIYNNNWPQYR